VVVDVVVVVLVTIMDMIMVQVLVELSNQNNLMVDVVVTNSLNVNILKAQEFLLLGFFILKTKKIEYNNLTKYKI
jgi:hypothetical protein